MYDERVRLRNEIVQLLKLKSLLDADKVLPLRFEAERKSLDSRRWELSLSGIRSLISRTATAERFTVLLQIPPGYPFEKMPDLSFGRPIPFHPHVWTDGRICWGSARPNPDLTLVDWFRALIEYLQHNQDRGSLYKINPDSQANADAMQWWREHKSHLARYIAPIDLGRLRFWIDQCHG